MADHPCTDLERGLRIAQVRAIPLNLPLELRVGATTKSSDLSCVVVRVDTADGRAGCGFTAITEEEVVAAAINDVAAHHLIGACALHTERVWERLYWLLTDRKSTRLNSSHQKISYAVFCL